MRFVDEVRVTVRSGRGGPGAVSFRREKYVPRGGPDGGDGGDGGNVRIVVQRELKTLYDLTMKHTIKAENGQPGSGQNKKGADGSETALCVPPGTVVTDAMTHEEIADLTTPGEYFVPVRGGRGGHGNARFKSAVNRSPRYAQSGQPGEERELVLQLKIIADIGIVGLPNVGKSTLLSTLTNARPKIADYPFTTLYPNLGVLHYKRVRQYVLADIPGLIEGASQGLGLGLRFLRHIERTKALLFLIDLVSGDPGRQYTTLVRELRQHSEALLQKPRITIGSKSDAADEEQVKVFMGADIHQIKLVVSSFTGYGIDALRDEIAHLLEKIDEKK
jgi:GTP-binding protein